MSLNLSEVSQEDTLPSQLEKIIESWNPRSVSIEFEELIFRFFNILEKEKGRGEGERVTRGKDGRMRERERECTGEKEGKDEEEEEEKKKNGKKKEIVELQQYTT